MSSAGIAAIISIIGAIALHAFDCIVGTHEACLMSRAMIWFYFVLMFVFFWPVVSLINSGSKSSKDDSQ